MEAQRGIVVAIPGSDSTFISAAGAGLKSANRAARGHDGASVEGGFAGWVRVQRLRMIPAPPVRFPAAWEALQVSARFFRIRKNARAHRHPGNAITPKPRRSGPDG